MVGVVVLRRVSTQVTVTTTSGVDATITRDVTAEEANATTVDSVLPPPPSTRYSNPHPKNLNLKLSPNP